MGEREADKKCGTRKKVKKEVGSPVMTVILQFSTIRFDRA